ncbi:hypothetical protein E7Z59_00225 [Robertkochia marina]|uniref:Uncharacterized protein n=1 Tax=Robertkochia marina TaxID=1227945 RepID=A0A4S3M3D5_9FLAO|nr:hypothetical protein [Robertkochia marina]THD68791.1 hypothetical protein E7Z59_00225 [Robertkochia marina]TRZ43864.1 hypothetical protein D3A96_09875 [Robertkochia marina]
MKRVLGAALFATLIMFGCQTSELSEEEKLLEVYSKAVISEPATITFDEGYAAGDLIEVVVPGGCTGEISIYAENPDFPGQNAAMIFDSNNPTGEDIDLGTPNQQYGGPGVSDSSSDGNEASNDTAQNNLLIITEDFDSEDPDDSFVEGSYYEINFSGYGSGSVTMDSFLMIDLDGESKGEGTFVRLFDGEDNLLLEKEILPMNDNGKQMVDLESTPGVVKMVLNLNNSGAIDDLKFHCENIITGCETMFAKDTEGMCFNDTDPAFQRWGWTNPLEEGFEGKLELWAGAGQCDTEKGTLVGYLHVTYMEGSLTATYEMMDGFYITETHFYAGTELYPESKNGRPTVAPGQYPGKNENLDYAKEDSYTVDGLSGSIYLIAHGEVCGDFEDDSYDNEYEDD